MKYDDNYENYRAIEDAIRHGQNFSENTARGMTDNEGNYLVSSYGTLMLKVSPTGQVLYFNDKYYSKTTSRLQNIIRRIMGKTLTPNPKRKHRVKKYRRNPQYWYFYLQPTPKEEKRGFHTVLKTRKQTKYVGWGDEDRARAYAHSIGRKLAGGYTGTTKSFKLDPHKIIVVPKGIKPMPKKMDLTDKIMAYESGELSNKDALKLFAHLIKTGLAWKLQGSIYGRLAKQLIDRGYISPEGRILKQLE